MPPKYSRAFLWTVLLLIGVAGLALAWVLRPGPGGSLPQPTVDDPPFRAAIADNGQATASPDRRVESGGSPISDTREQPPPAAATVRGNGKDGGRAGEPRAVAPAAAAAAPAAPEIEALRMPVPALSWGPTGALAYSKDESKGTVEWQDGSPSSSGPVFGRHEGGRSPENCMFIDVRAFDLVANAENHTEIPIVDVEIVDHTGTRRAAGRVDTRTHSKNRYLRFPYPEDARLLVRVSHGDKVGIATFGTGPGAIDRLDGSSTVRAWPGRRYAALIWLGLATEHERLAQGIEVRVVDVRGRPIEGAVAYRGNEIAGRTDASGVMRVIPVDSSHVHARWPVAIHSPGKVPVFLKNSDFLGGRPVDVALKAEEVVVRFKHMLHHSTIIDHGPHVKQDLSVVPEGVTDLRKALAKANWGASGYSPFGTQENVKKLSRAIGRDAAPAGDYYSRWYCRMWTYNPDTWEWTVVLPFPDRYIITVARGSFGVIYPGLYLDARDPAKPQYELIYAP